MPYTYKVYITRHHRLPLRYMTFKFLLYIPGKKVCHVNTMISITKQAKKVKTIQGIKNVFLPGVGFKVDRHNDVALLI